MAEYIQPGIGPAEVPEKEYIQPGVGPAGAVTTGGAGVTVSPILMMDHFNGGFLNG